MSASACFSITTAKLRLWRLLPTTRCSGWRTVYGDARRQVKNPQPRTLIRTAESQRPTIHDRADMGVSENRGYLILGFLYKGSYYLGYYIRVPCFRNPHILCASCGLLTGLALSTLPGPNPPNRKAPVLISTAIVPEGSLLKLIFEKHTTNPSSNIAAPILFSCIPRTWRATSPA